MPYSLSHSLLKKPKIHFPSVDRLKERESNYPVKSFSRGPLNW